MAEGNKAEVPPLGKILLGRKTASHVEAVFLVRNNKLLGRPILLVLEISNIYIRRAKQYGTLYCRLYRICT